MYIRAEDVQPGEGRKQLVTKLNDEIKSNKALHKDAMKRMRDSQYQARNGASKQWRKGAYTVNITQRAIKQRTSYLYAKNPRMAAKRRPKLWYRLWDGNPDSLAMAMQVVSEAAQAGMEPPPDAVALLQEHDTVQRAQEQIDRIGKTLEVVFQYYVDEQNPPFKTQMKQLIRRADTNTVAYVKLGFQREMGKSEQLEAQIDDMRVQLASTERLMQQVATGDTKSPERDEELLRLQVQALEEQQDIILREGLVFHFPKSTDIIPDGLCTQLRGFVNCEMLTHQMFMTPDRIAEVYGVMVKGMDYTEYQNGGSKDFQPTSKKQTKAPRETFGCVFETYHKPSGLMLTTLDGYHDFLEEPRPPKVTVESFWPIYAISFTQQEDEEELYPPSNVELIRHQQMEMNRAREARRQHRIAARPGWVTGPGTLEDPEKEALQSRQNMAVIEVAALAPGQDIRELFQSIPMPGIDPNLYETGTTFDDVQLISGAQEATFGGLSGATATETSISEASRSSVVSDDVDEFNDFLSEIAEASGQILLRETSVEEAQRIAGPGAVWPELTDEEIMSELYLDVAAGSNGRPNQGAELAATERVLPIALQIPGFSPDWLRKHIVRLLDDTADFSEAFDPSAPSIVSQNDMRQPATGNPATEPTQQGGQGGSAAQAPGSQQGPAPGAPQLVAGVDVR